MSGQARDEAGKTHFRPVGRAPVLSDRIPERCWAAADSSACGVAMTRCKTVCAPPSRSAVFLCVLCGLRFFGKKPNRRVGGERPQRARSLGWRVLCSTCDCRDQSRRRGGGARTPVAPPVRPGAAYSLFQKSRFLRLRYARRRNDNARGAAAAFSRAFPTNDRLLSSKINPLPPVHTNLRPRHIIWPH